MDVARINLAHGTKDEHAATIALVRRVAAQRGMPLAILIDLPGSKLRKGTRHDRSTSGRGRS